MSYRTCFQQHVQRSYFSTITRKSRLLRPISVAPMVDISTPHFLELLHIVSGKRHVYYTEMYHAHAIIQHQGHLARFVGTPRPNVVVQLGGADPKILATAAHLLQTHGYSEININVGCPSQNVQHGNFGAILMKTPSLVADILNAMTSIDLPVTVKCRIGVDELDSFDFFHSFVETLMQSKCPPPHLIVHARKCILKGLSPKKNRTIPPLNYQRVYDLANAFPQLPISINGGFRTTESIRHSLNQVDGCMIGRAIMDAPLFLQQIDRDIYQVPEDQVKSPLAVIEEYLDYAEVLLATQLDQNETYGLPPLTILIRPLMMLFQGKQGRSFRRELSHQLQQHRQQTPSHLRNIIQRTLDNAGIC